MGPKNPAPSNASHFTKEAVFESIRAMRLILYRTKNPHSR